MRVRALSRPQASGLVFAVLLAVAVPAAAQEPPRAGEKAPPEAEKSDRPQPALILEDHRLFFERAILSCAPKGLRATDFTIGYEKEKGDHRRGGLLIEVPIQFQRDQKPLPLSRSVVREVIRAVETTGDSPWRLGELRTQATPDDVSLWLVDRLVFWRGTGTYFEEVVGGPTGVFDAFVATLDDVKEKGVDCSVTSIRIVQRLRRGQAPYALLTVDYLVSGERFRRDYVKIEKVLTRAIEDPDHPFAQFEEPATEEIVKGDEPYAAKYRVSLRVRGEM